MKDNSKKPHPVDVLVGARIRRGRTMSSMSQETLGKALGITFQQIQKYEKGTNRASASRLAEISKITRLPISWFFQDIDQDATAQTLVEDPTHNFIQSSEGIKLCKAFVGLQTEASRSAVHAFIKQLSSIEYETQTIDPRAQIVSENL
ncbi:helix-turn-helix domain-containing protein [Allorhizobium sp. BGMRC 0089]|uniref:helix-turn-helix domain-containing protein n=1 Tax=Allorhizobium sonneratiae TaxID=2934936 RepID=UPI0020335BC5|nr:helix-turn-helix transcriptional regulator [Allorhizobium sonneratiae]MCM2294690.1 helix-turn-helix domain-containing protein [Allorhizobium sonneratiae]